MKYKIGDILKSKYSCLEVVISGRDSKGDVYKVDDDWASEKIIDDNWTLLTPHEDVNENAKTVHIDVKDVNEYHPWRAEFADEYWFVDCFGDIRKGFDYHVEVDDYRFDTGNYFRTKEEAEHYGEYLLAKQTLKNDAKGFVPDWNSSHDKYFVYQLSDGYFRTDSFMSYHGACLYFANKEDAQASIGKHEKEWRIVFDWENGKR